MFGPSDLKSQCIQVAHSGLAAMRVNIRSMKSLAFALWNDEVLLRQLYGPRGTDRPSESPSFKGTNRPSEALTYRYTNTLRKKKISDRDPVGIDKRKSQIET